jgi:hypothetical protein
VREWDRRGTGEKAGLACAVYRIVISAE